MWPLAVVRRGPLSVKEFGVFNWGAIMDEIQASKNPASQFMLWIAGVALGLAYVVYPLTRLYCALWSPHTVVPELDLKDMWVPVFAITGVSGLGIASHFVRSRENRKDKELEIQRCSSCPTANCAACPLKKIAEERA